MGGELRADGKVRPGRDEGERQNSGTHISQL
jgi:hypothetical protein